MSRRERPSRVGLTLCLLVPLGLMNQSPVRAWSNGSSGPNSYGTHDWILDQAVRVSQAAQQHGELGQARCCPVGDRRPRHAGRHRVPSSPWWHVYDVHGERYGNAPEAIRVWFKKAARQLASGHRKKASRSLGILAHLLGDLANPMHTDQTKREDGIHSSYEEAVDSRSGSWDGIFQLLRMPRFRATEADQLPISFRFQPRPAESIKVISISSTVSG